MHALPRLEIETAFTLKSGVLLLWRCKILEYRLDEDALLFEEGRHH